MNDFKPIPIAQQMQMYATASSVFEIVAKISSGEIHPQHINWDTIKHDVQWLMRSCKGPFPPEIGPTRQDTTA